MSIVERTRQIVDASPSRSLRWLPLAALMIDLITVSASGIVGYLGRTYSDMFARGINVDNTLGWPAALMIVGWVCCIALLGGYERSVFGSGADEFKRVARATFLTGAVVGIGCYLTKFQLSRGFFVMGLLAGFVLVFSGRLLLRKVIHSARRRGVLLARVVVAGSVDHVDEVAHVLGDRPWLGYSIVGAVTPSYETRDETDTGVPILGRLDDVVSVATKVGTDVIFFAAGSVPTGRALKERTWELESHDIQVVVAPSLTDVSVERVTVRPVGGLPLIHVEHPTWTKATRLGKRTFDLVGSGLLILALSPIFAFVAARIWLADRGPLIYRQQRVGRRSEYFDCLKFRTMVVDADAMIEKLQQETNQNALLFKMKDDPRITKPGKWLRRFSIDELPQLFNVFRGDMSLVGPRPQVQKEVDLYQGGMERRLLVRPGMTGLWQVSGRSDLSATEAQRLDLFYVDNWSMLQDLAILCRTVGAVFGSKGAY